MICCENIVDVTFFLIPFQISTTTIFFSPPIFDNGIATIATKFYFPISAMALPQLVSFLSTSHFKHTAHTQAAGLGSRNFGNHITEIQNFLSPTFLFLSHTFVEFQQHRCQNSLSFLISLNKLKQCL